MTMRKAVLGIATNEHRAGIIVGELQWSGFPNGNISVLFPDRKGMRDFAYEIHTKAPEGAVAGATTGAAVGGTIGLLVGIGALAIPGLGPFIAAGPIMAALRTTVGGLPGALASMGIPELEAKQYEGKVRGGGILVSVHVDSADERTLARRILESNHATDVVTVGAEAVPKKKAVYAVRGSRRMGEAHPKR
jgi:hypothetical protein